MSEADSDPDQYVQENKDTLVRIIKHGDDKFVRGLALAAIIRYGDEPLLHDIEHEIDRAKQDMEERV
ncbi:hypothetical protein A6E15_13890 [Natrinema saccharevitans]|uniref:HEAT repeat domain-containing protein n=1 Tax=Natrinema saccharevitans TaxID=301967 RepID=A0A1S8AZC7_9EURY|nr:hypothetical protein [Natrinema saccharevitans]OLZ42002.1 hypothetical protein A6E15_13890 [Natrinema saccharevitans]